jgi:predicted nucleic acid-binding protein
VYEDAGHALRALQRSGYQVARSGSLVNDVLVAFSARSIGATVITGNATDFAAIREVRSFMLTVVPA